MNEYVIVDKQGNGAAPGFTRVCSVPTFIMKGFLQQSRQLLSQIPRLETLLFFLCRSSEGLGQTQACVTDRRPSRSQLKLLISFFGSISVKSFHSLNQSKPLTQQHSDAVRQLFVVPHVLCREGLKFSESEEKSTHVVYVLTPWD